MSAIPVSKNFGWRGRRCVQPAGDDALGHVRPNRRDGLMDRDHARGTPPADREPGRVRWKTDVQRRVPGDATTTLEHLSQQDVVDRIPVNA
jgi:hypothetical protein